MTCERLEANRLVQAQPTTARWSASGLADGVAPDRIWRLMIAIGPAQSGNRTNGGRLQLDFLLYNPETSDFSKPKELAVAVPPANGGFAFDELDGLLLSLFQKANKIIREKYQCSKPCLLLMLSLPGGFFRKHQWRTLVDRVREAASELQRKPPVALACLSRQHGLEGKGRPAHRLADANGVAHDTSVELVQTMAKPGSVLADLNWLLVDGESLLDDQSLLDGDGASVSHHPCWTGERFDAVNSDGDAEQLDDKQWADVQLLGSRQSIYFGSAAAANQDWQQIITGRMFKLLLKGVPMFWLEAPSPPTAKGPHGHPGRRLLASRCDTFLAEFCLFHARPVDAGEAWKAPGYKEQVAFIRNGYLFWEDHRFRPPDLRCSDAALSNVFF